MAFVYLTAAEAAAHLRLLPNYLAKLRHAGGGPPFYKASGRVILYRRDHLEAWLDARRYGSTSQVPIPATGRAIRGEADNGAPSGGDANR
jgi:hypothetical protein